MSDLQEAEMESKTLLREIQQLMRESDENIQKYTLVFEDPEINYQKVLDACDGVLRELDNNIKELERISALPQMPDRGKEIITTRITSDKKSRQEFVDMMQRISARMRSAANAE